MSLSKVSLPSPFAGPMQVGFVAAVRGQFGQLLQVLVSRRLTG